MAAPLAPLAPMVSLRAERADSTIAGVRIGVQSYSFRDRPLDRAIAAMKDVGLTFCELWQDHVETPQRMGIDAALRGSARRDALRHWRLTVPMDVFHLIRQSFERAGITLTAYNISFADDFTDDEIARAFDMAKALGAAVITSSSRIDMPRRVDPFARKAGMKVGFHNHSNTAPGEVATAADFAAALKNTSNMMAINLDIGHFTAADGDPLAFLDAHHDRIVSIHLKDRKKHQGDNVPWGEGDTPITPVLRRLRDRHWNIPANIEYEYKGADTVQAVRSCFEYCRTALNAK